jgi:hypothetical protein
MRTKYKLWTTVNLVSIKLDISSFSCRVQRRFQPTHVPFLERFVDTNDFYGVATVPLIDIKASMYAMVPVCNSDTFGFEVDEGLRYSCSVN